MAAHARNAMMACSPLGTMPATRSPGPTPAARSAAAKAATSARSASRESTSRAPHSRRAISAGSSPVWRSRFSAKFSVAPGKKRARIISSPGVNATSPGAPITAPSSHTARQKSAGCAMEKACSSAKLCMPVPCRAFSRCMKRAMRLSFSNDSDGVHRGVSVRGMATSRKRAGEQDGMKANESPRGQ